MKKYNLKYIFTLLAVMLIGHGCADLEVENLNNPDAARAIATPQDLKSIVSGGFYSWWTGVHLNYQPSVHLDGLADAMTTTNAFARFWDFTNEPRLKIDNSLTYSGLSTLTIPWRNLNSAVSSSNDVISAIKIKGLKIMVNNQDQTNMVLASAYFLRGISQGYLANIFDKGFVVLEDTDLTALELQPNTEVLAAAIASLDECIALCNANSFTLDAFMPGLGGYTSAQFAQLANSYAARFLISNSRTQQENMAVDWSKVLAYAEKGIQQDFVIELDGNNWYNLYQYISGLHWYFRIDNRIIRLMDPTYPKKYPAEKAGTAIPTATSADARLETDFQYDTRQNFFNIARGPVLQSNYFFVRYIEQWESEIGSGDGPIFLKAENDLMIAEAKLRLGDKPAATAIINNGTRVTRGNLEPLAATATEAEVLAAIYYERDIELLRTGTGLQFFDMRRRDALQAGTPLHFPIPADELVTIGEENYTFGGAANIGQEGTATGANSWDK